MRTSRREFLQSATLGCLAAPLLPRATAQQPAHVGLAVDAWRLQQDIEALSVFGRPSGGTFADGVSRVGYSDADVAGREYILGLMRGIGLTPRVDAAGNILADRPGRDPSLPPVLFGSHIDSVPNGGNFDGDLGTLGALEAIRALDAARVTTRRPLRFVMWANEEWVAFGNGLCGSRAAAGHLEENEMEHVWNGIRKADAVRKIGGSPDRIVDARMLAGSFHAYLELHIEQGGSLERASIPIGVVEGIVAIDRHDVVIHGVANHAGTTPMPERHDALLAAAELALAVREIVTKDPGRQVGTVGQLTVTPNAPNVIPGLVRHTVELRDLSSAKIAALAETIRTRAADIAVRTGTRIEMTRVAHHEAALATPSVQRVIEETVAKLKLESRRLPSGAGHDAQMMATLAPMGMIFVPSVGGVSHAPAELTRWEDCARGANVLLHAVLELAR